MEKTKIELIKITASEGKWLTNGDTYSKEVYLGVNDSVDNWHEITEAEYNEILKRQEEDLEANKNLY